MSKAASSIKNLGGDLVQEQSELFRDIPGEQGEQTGERCRIFEIHTILFPMPALTDVPCKNVSGPPDKSRTKLADSGGLYLEVAQTGSKRWFWKYRINGIEKRLALGAYPQVRLAETRSARDAARLIHKDGTDPVQQRRTEKTAKRVSAAITFEAVAREYHESKSSGWSTTRAAQSLRCMENDLFPWVGTLPLRDVTAPVLLDALRRVEAREAMQLVRDLREFAGQAFRYGIGCAAFARP